MEDIFLHPKNPNGVICAAMKDDHPLQQWHVAHTALSMGQQRRDYHDIEEKENEEEELNAEE